MSKLLPALADIGKMEEIDLEFSEENTLKDSSIISPLASGKFNLDITIQNELGTIWKQLETINKKIQINMQIIASKQQENQEIKKIIDLYKEKKGESLRSSVTCSCTKNCTIF
ncbi:hypothetical protein SteCoe_33885 [Stentor coeruleus]|uniref:Uncharacterized protein n=1 Tax=Stentor coeruleus TaxID=5963 RepID=A0A1R2AVP4_9CILI|nr:hypothetical protein SteCoe_33885 [Stentor coeruleus]